MRRPRLHVRFSSAPPVERNSNAGGSVKRTAWADHDYHGLTLWLCQMLRILTGSAQTLTGQNVVLGLRGSWSASAGGRHASDDPPWLLSITCWVNSTTVGCSGGRSNVASHTLVLDRVVDGSFLILSDRYFCRSVSLSHSWGLLIGHHFPDVFKN